MKSQGEMFSPLLCHGGVVQLNDMQPSRVKWLPQQYGCNPTFDHNTGWNDREGLSVFSLIDSVG